RRQAVQIMEAMLAESSRSLAANGVSQVGWLPRNRWPDEWMQALGFAYLDEVVTYVKRDLDIPTDVHYNHNVVIKDVKAADLPQLVEIEEAAFQPLWRHSVESLQIGWRHALSFHVAEIDGRVV